MKRKSRIRFLLIGVTVETIMLSAECKLILVAFKGRLTSTKREDVWSGPAYEGVRLKSMFIFLLSFVKSWPSLAPEAP